MNSSQRFVNWRGELLILQSPLSPDEAVEHLKRNIETSYRLGPTFFFSGEVQGYTFTLVETIHFGKRDTGIRMFGEIAAMDTGSEISIRIQPLVPAFVLWVLLIVFGAIGFAYLSCLIFLGQYPVSCLIVPSILVGVFGLVLYSSLSDSTPAYANIESHLRQIFMVTAPTRRLPKRQL